MADATSFDADTDVDVGDSAPPLAQVLPLRRPGMSDQVTPDEQTLIRQAQSGDLGAYEVLVRRYQAIAYHTAVMIVGATDAEDVTQEAFLKVFRHITTFRPTAPFRPWVLTIVANEARNRRRSARRYLTAIRRAAGQRILGDLSADERTASLERRSTLLDVVRTLPERERLVVHCRYLLELSESETAEVLRVPVGTVKSRLVRALHHLRELIADESSELGEGRS